MDILNSELPVFDDQGHPLLIEGQGHANTADDTHIIMAACSNLDDSDVGNIMQNDTDLDMMPVQGQVNEPDVFVNVQAANDLDIVTVEKCHKCDRRCVMCILNKAQQDIQTALREMNHSGPWPSSSMYCSCVDHKHVCSHNCTS